MLALSGRDDECSPCLPSQAVERSGFALGSFGPRKLGTRHKAALESLLQVSWRRVLMGSSESSASNVESSPASSTTDLYSLLESKSPSGAYACRPSISSESYGGRKQDGNVVIRNQAQLAKQLVWSQGGWERSLNLSRSAHVTASDEDRRNQML